MLILRFAVCFCFSITIATAGTADAATFDAGGLYDEQVVSQNAVDRDANPGYTAADASADVAAASLAGRGGVVSFDAAGPLQDRDLTIAFAGRAKRFTLTRGVGGDGANGYDIAGRGPIGSRVAVSGGLGDDGLAGTGDDFFGAIDNDGDSIDFNFGNFIGFDDDEQIVTAGLTVLSRSEHVSRAGTATAFFTDAGTASLRFDAGGGAQLRDSFVGFRAPAGRGITRLRFDFDDATNFTSLDDLAFTTTATLEPASLAMLALAGPCLLGRRRR